MNILLHVTAVLLILSVITYAKLDIFRSNYTLQKLYQKTMAPLQRSLLDEAQVKAYEEHHIPKEKKEGEATPPPPPNDPETAQYRSKLSLWPFFDPANKTTRPPQKQQTAVFLKKLLAQLYGKNPLFQEIEETHPGIIETLVEEMIKSATKLSKDVKIKSPDDLANLPLEDPLLNEVLYKMLKGDPSKPFQRAKPDEAAEISADETVTEKEEEPPQKETLYPKLSDYITLYKGKGVRVFLASKELLTVIFGDLGVVDAILETRKDLQRQVVKGRNPQEAAKEFEALFLPKRDPSIDPSFLNFDVSKTNPRTYD